jgi:hypothetical protein
MVLTFEQEKELVTLKHEQTKEILIIKNQYDTQQHAFKLMRLEKLLEIAKLGGKVEKV